MIIEGIFIGILFAVSVLGCAYCSTISESEPKYTLSIVIACGFIFFLGAVGGFLSAEKCDQDVSINTSENRVSTGL